MRWVRRLLGATALAALVAVPACGSDDDENAGNRVGEVYCNLIKPCCAERGLPTTLNACRFLFSFPAADAAAAEECAAGYEELAKRDDWCDIANTQRPEACERAYPQQEQPAGKQLLGDRCDFTDDCAPQDGRVSCVGNICRLLTPAAAGAECFGEVYTSGGTLTINVPETGNELPVCYEKDGLACANGTCVIPQPVGQACEANAGCVDDAYCDENVCKARPRAGDACDSFYDRCVDGTYCNGTICEATRAAGEPCTDYEQCESTQCDEGVCAEGGSLGDLGYAFVCG